MTKSDTDKNKKEVKRTLRECSIATDVAYSDPKWDTEKEGYEEKDAKEAKTLHETGDTSTKDTEEEICIEVEISKKEETIERSNNQEKEKEEGGIHILSAKHVEVPFCSQGEPNV